MWTTATTECFKMMLNFVKEDIVDDRIWKIAVRANCEFRARKHCYYNCVIRDIIVDNYDPPQNPYSLTTSWSSMKCFTNCYSLMLYKLKLKLVNVMTLSLVLVNNMLIVFSMTLRKRENPYTGRLYLPLLYWNLSTANNLQPNPTFLPFDFCLQQSSRA